MSAIEQALSTNEDQSIDKRWTTVFGLWVKNFGVQKLVDELGVRGYPVTSSCIYLWVAGATTPKIDKAREIVKISGGDLTLEDVFKRDQTISKRWTTNFGRWIKDFGVQNLVFQLRAMDHSVTPACIYLWIAGTCAPRADKAMEIVRIAGGELTLADVFNHQEEMKTNEQ